MLSQSKGQTVPQFGCSTGKCSDKVFFGCFFGRHWVCEDEVAWRTADDSLEGSEALVPEGTRGLSIHATLHRSQDVVVNKHFNR